jgi:hypothetical protein
LINRLADSTERIEPLPAALALVEKVSNRLFDQLSSFYGFAAP